MNKLTDVPNLTERTYRSIKEHLLDGTLTEGTRLTEEQLAGQLGTSKSPIREALNRLETEGLVSIESRRGAHVRRFSSKEVSDLYEVREMLEMHAVATAEITDELLSELAASIERTKKFLAAGDRPKHIEEDIRFHRLIANAAQNAEFCRILDNVQQKTLICRYKTYYLSGSASPLGHTRIYQGLKKDDRAAAQRAMQEHIRYAKDRLLYEIIQETINRSPSESS